MVVGDDDLAVITCHQHPKSRSGENRDERTKCLSAAASSDQPRPIRSWKTVATESVDEDADVDPATGSENHTIEETPTDDIGLPPVHLDPDPTTGRIDSAKHRRKSLATVPEDANHVRPDLDRRAVHGRHERGRVGWRATTSIDRRARRLPPRSRASALAVVRWRE
jgi:hypothetical protein